MKLFDSICETLTRVLGLSALALPTNHGTSPQQPLSQDLGLSVTMEAKEPPLAVETLSPNKSPNDDMGQVDLELPEGPVFKPPNSSQNFTCDYRSMRGWKHTAGVGARTQWLERTNSPKFPFGGVFDIWTDYEAFWPTGTTRKVCDPLLMRMYLAYGHLLTRIYLSTISILLTTTSMLMASIAPTAARRSTKRIPVPGLRPVGATHWKSRWRTI